MMAHIREYKNVTLCCVVSLIFILFPTALLFKWSWHGKRTACAYIQNRFLYALTLFAGRTHVQTNVEHILCSTKYCDWNLCAHTQGKIFIWIKLGFIKWKRTYIRRGLNACSNVYNAYIKLLCTLCLLYTYDMNCT